MNDTLKRLARSGALTIKDLARYGALVGAQIRTANYGPSCGMGPGVWEFVIVDENRVGLGKVGKRGTLLKAGPGKRYSFAMSGARCFTMESLMAALGAELVAQAGDGEALATRKRRRSNSVAKSYVVKRETRRQSITADYGSEFTGYETLGVVTATSERKAKNAAKREFGAVFAGLWRGAHLDDRADAVAKARAAGAREIKGN